jgi:hypothetical protein
VRANEFNFASHMVWLAVLVGDGAIGRPAHLPYKPLAGERVDVQKRAHFRGRANLLSQTDAFVGADKGGTRRIVAAILEALQKRFGLFPHRRILILVDKRNVSAHMRDYTMGLNFAVTLATPFSSEAGALK